jgi:hypothetical protein
VQSHIRLIALCSVGLCMPLLVPLFQGRVLTENDLSTYYIPIRHLYAEALRAGDSVLWSSAMFSGHFTFGEGQVGMAHPLHYVLFKYLPLSVAVNLEILSGYLAALVGGRLLLGRLGLSREAAWFGAMLFAFSGFNLLHLIHVNAVQIIGHLPWILLCVHVLLTAKSGRDQALGFAGTAVAIGSQLLLGYPQYVWLTLLAAGYLSVCLVIAGAPRWRLLLATGAVAAGALIGAVQVLPTLDIVSTSHRSDPSLDFRLTFSLNPLNLIQLVSPHAFEDRVYAHPGTLQVHESSSYSGAFCTLALAWLAIRFRALERRRLAIAFIGLAFISLVFALGRYGGVYAFVAQLPGVNLFRAPARHVLLFHLALSGIAALVFEDLVHMVRQRMTTPWRRLWPLAVPAILSVVITAIAAVFARSSWARGLNLMFAELSVAGPWTALFVVTAGLFVLASRGARWSISALLVLASLDLGFWGYLYVYRSPPRTIVEMAEAAQVPPLAQPGDLFEPIKGANVENLGLLKSLRITTGLVPLVPAAVLKFDHPVTQRVSGVRWRPDRTQWVALTDSMPRARLLASAELSEDIAQDITRIDVAETALVAKPVGELSGSPGHAVVASDRPGHLVIRTSAPGRQLLVVTERFHPGWRGTEDGRECAPLAVYGDFLGCVVSAGTHEITFRFAPDSVRKGLRLTLVGLLATVALSVVLWRFDGRRARADAR